MAVLAFASHIVRLATHQVRCRFASALNNRKASLLRRCLDRGLTPPRWLHGLTVDQIYTFAELDHADLGLLTSDVLLLRATQGNGDIGDEPFMNLYADPLLGWGRRVGGALDVVDLPGGHYSMFQEPQVKGLADRIQAHIDAARAR